jgi:hypothetical protein
VQRNPTATMIVGLVLSLGMGGLFLGWLNLNEGSGLVGLLFIAGFLFGLATVAIGATSKGVSDA